MKKPKHIRTEPIYGVVTGKRIGTSYIYDEEEMKRYREYKKIKKHK